MKAVNVLLTIFVSLFIAFGVFEIGLRLVGFGTPASLNEFDPKLGWSKKKNAHVTRKTGEFKVTFETNAEGLRDDATAVAKKAGVMRVMMLGDSFVQGYTVDRDDLFVDQLEGWWKSEERRVEVINAGTEAYSTDQEALWFREHGAAYQPDVVILFPYLNDIYWNGHDRYQRYPKPRFAPDGTLETGELEDPGKVGWANKLAIRKFMSFVRAALQGGARPGGPNYFQPPGAEFPIQREFAPLLNATPEFLNDALARTKGALKALKADCDQAGAKLFLCPVPPETALYDDEKADFVAKHFGNLPDSAWSPMKPVQTFLAMADELGIKTMDPRQAFQRRVADGERLYFKEEWHFNPAGNVAMADFLHKEFDNNALFPAEHQALSAGGIPAPSKTGGTPTFVIVYAVLWILLTILYLGFYRDEPLWQPPLKVAGLLALVFTVILGGGKLVALLPPNVSKFAVVAFVLGILGFVAYKLGRRLGTIFELLKAFTLRGHWYLMPLVVILLTIGSLLVVAASSPLVAPFIYTLF
jgi:lysophospholipase L1-like esterase